jgi:hypothetical protein
MEGVVLAERQTGALFGSVEELAQEMSRALQGGGEPITTPDELMKRVGLRFSLLMSHCDLFFTTCFDQFVVF